MNNYHYIRYCIIPVLYYLNILIRVIKILSKPGQQNKTRLPIHSWLVVTHVLITFIG